MRNVSIMTTVAAIQFLPPANEVCEGYVFTGVCLSTGGSASGPGVCGRHPLADTPFWQTPPFGRHPLSDTPMADTPPGDSQQAGSTHPTGMHSC